MSQFEQLLSNDPIGAFNKIKEDYLRYFKTTFRFAGEIDENTQKEKYKDLDDRKNAELEDKDKENLSKELYCELLPKYESSNMLMDAICNGWTCINPLPNGFADFIKKGLMEKEDGKEYPLYRHQKEMLEKGFGEGKNVLITSGTGSCKTESFMLPLLASLLKEAQGWSKQTYDANWWHLRDSFGKYCSNQRKNENRTSAIRAVLLYPMNALVADQVGRLRKALDSDTVRNFLDSECNENRIFFGSYNGNTPKASKEETAMREVIFSGQDGKVYFINLKSGEPSRDPINIGFPILECPEAAKAINKGDRVTVDPETGVITDETTGQTFQAAAFPPFIGQIIENGGLLPYLKNRQKG